MERFFNKVHKTNSCWNWTASTRQGYGAFKFRGKTEGAHRVSWIIHNGEIPDGLYVCHKCDNRKCVNPDHLFIGTASDNMIDCSRKGRLVTPIGKVFEIGHRPHNARPEQEISLIKEAIMKRSGTLKQLSLELGVSYQLLRDINSGRVYKDL